MCYGKTKPAHKKLSLLSLLSLKTTLSFRILSCVCFKDNRDNRDNFFSYRNFCFKTIGTILIVQPEAPQRNDVAEACFYIVLHDIGIVQTFYLLFALLATANLEGVFANDEI